MKLQTKFTLYFILLVFITLFFSFVLIHWHINRGFNRFIQEKRVEVENYLRERGLSEEEINRRKEQVFRNEPRRGLRENNLHRLFEGGRPEERFLGVTRYALVQAGAISLLLAIILGYVFSRYFLKRIVRLSHAMNQYKEKGEVIAVPESSTDEIDDLAHIYNLLIRKVENQERIRKEFFVDMSHELRTPMTSIKGYLEGLVDGVFDPKKEKEIHQKTLQETDRMIHLIKEMTTLAKLEAGDNLLNKKNTQLRKLTETVVDMLSYEVQEKDIQVQIHGQAEVFIDQNKFKQVLVNLLDNALSHGSPKSTVQIEIEVKKQKTFWRIKNHSDHVEEKDLEFLFERFYRSDKSRTYNAKKQHLGIGLNIVKKIVELHEGQIRARLEGEEVVFEVVL